MLKKSNILAKVCLKMYYFILLFFTFYYCLLLFINVYYFYYCLLLSITVYYCLLLLITFLYCLLLHITVCYFLLFCAVQPNLLGCPAHSFGLSSSPIYTVQPTHGLSSPLMGCLAHPQGLPSPPPMSCPAHPLLFFCIQACQVRLPRGGPTDHTNISSFCFEFNRRPPHGY